MALASNVSFTHSSPESCNNDIWVSKPPMRTRKVRAYSARCALSQTSLFARHWEAKSSNSDLGGDLASITQLHRHSSSHLFLNPRIAPIVDNGSSRPQNSSLLPTLPRSDTYIFPSHRLRFILFGIFYSICRSDNYTIQQHLPIHLQDAQVASSPPSQAPHHLQQTSAGSDSTNFHSSHKHTTKTRRSRLVSSGQAIPLSVISNHITPTTTWVAALAKTASSSRRRPSNVRRQSNATKGTPTTGQQKVTSPKNTSAVARSTANSAL